MGYSGKKMTESWGIISSRPANFFTVMGDELMLLFPGKVDSCL
jgi:hypothetical protein